jgi:hypothetical protein
MATLEEGLIINPSLLPALPAGMQIGVSGYDRSTGEANAFIVKYNGKTYAINNSMVDAVTPPPDGIASITELSGSSDIIDSIGNAIGKVKVQMTTPEGLQLSNFDGTSKVTTMSPPAGLDGFTWTPNARASARDYENQANYVSQKYGKEVQDLEKDMKKFLEEHGGVKDFQSAFEEGGKFNSRRHQQNLNLVLHASGERGGIAEDNKFGQITGNTTNKVAQIVSPGKAAPLPIPGMGG